MPMEIILATALQIFTPQHHLCTLRGCTCRANTGTLACNHRAIHCQRPGLAALLLALPLSPHCSLLCSLLCTSCSFLQRAAQRHSRATLPVRHAFSKRFCARVPLRHRAPLSAPFATYKAHASRPPPRTAHRHHPHAAHSMIDNVSGTRSRHLLRADHRFCPRARASAGFKNARRAPASTKSSYGSLYQQRIVKFRPSPPRGGGAARPPIRGRAHINRGKKTQPAPRTLLACRVSKGGFGGRGCGPGSCMCEQCEDRMSGRLSTRPRLVQ